MLAIGQFNQLSISRLSDFGAYLCTPEGVEVLLPRNETAANAEVGQIMDAFIYLDSEDRLVATLKQPKAQVGQCAFLKVAEINDVGIFLDWGLPKDLFLPFSEQAKPMEVGNNYLVYLYLDQQNRILASAKLDRFFDKTEPNYQRGDKVEAIIAGRTELGYKAVVDQEFWGVLYYNEVFERLRVGMKVTAYITKQRDDLKLDLRLTHPTKPLVEGLEARIMERLIQEGGYLGISDKSDPKLITAVFNVSKAAYKKAIGSLYKQKKIKLSKKGILLADE
jgi:predicted RNA-binding protein (virulence factor B family)